MEHYKTTHETDWRRVKWVHDYEYDPVRSVAYPNDKETQEAIDVEQKGLDNGTLVVLGALVEVKCPHCKFWQDSDSLWGIVVDTDEDLEVWGTENLSIPEAPKAPETVGCDNVSERAQFHLDVARLIPLSKRAQDYVKSVAETPPEDLPPPPKGPQNLLIREDDTSGGRPMEITEGEARNVGTLLGVTVLLAVLCLALLVLLAMGGS